MARYLPSAGMGREAFRPFGAVPAYPGIAPVFPIPFPVGRAPCQLVPLRTQGNVFDWVKGETIFPETVPLVHMPPSARLYPGLRQPVTHGRAVVSRVQSHVLGLLPQSLFNILSYLCYGFCVVDIGRRKPYIYHNVVLVCHVIIDLFERMP